LRKPEGPEARALLRKSHIDGLILGRKARIFDKAATPAGVTAEGAGVQTGLSRL
jgi:hypothetical protein